MRLDSGKLVISLVWTSIIVYVFNGIVATAAYWLNIAVVFSIHYSQFLLVLLFILLLPISKRRVKKSNSEEYLLSSRFFGSFGILAIISLIIILLWEYAALHLDDEVPFILLSGFRLKWVVSLIFIGIYVVIDMGTELLKRWRVSLAEAERYQKQEVQSKLETLKAQINPHFLFNSLNTLSGLIYEDQDKASFFLRRVSAVYRHILEARDKNVITIQEELKIAKDYIDLIHIRFPEMVKIQLDIDSSYLLHKIAPLSLQMLMENAIKHNEASESNCLNITIQTHPNATISVLNNLQERKTMESSTKVGLENIKARYKYLSNRTVIVNHTDSHFEVIIPLIPPQ
jgi:two-component system, LytTR family, sensor kinase